MHFKVLNDYKSVEDYLVNFLKISKKNLHAIRMQTHQDNNTILVNNDIAKLNTSLAKNDVLKLNIELSKSNYLTNKSISITKLLLLSLLLSYFLLYKFNINKLFVVKVFCY